MKLDEKNQNGTGGTARYSYENSAEQEASQATTEESFSPPSVASRARNRTVMLSPDITGQVRNLLQTAAPNKNSANDPFQKPSEVAPIVVQQELSKEDHVTGTFTNLGSMKSANTGTLQRMPLMEGLLREDTSITFAPSAKSDKVEGTLELKHEHFRRATGERKLEELGIGVPPSAASGNQNFLTQSLREPTATITSTSPVRDFAHTEEFKVQDKIVAPIIKAEIASRIIGFLVSYDNTEFGEVTELRVGRWLVSSKSNAQQDVLVFEDSSISALHAVIKVSESGVVQIMDQLSDRGSGVLKVQTGKELDASESAVKVQHGDLVRFGNRYFVYCAIPKIQIEN